MDLPDLQDDLPPLGHVVATRRLNFASSLGQSEPVLISVGTPTQRNGAWWCPYEIRSSSFTRAYALAGEDSMQALLGSICILSTELEALAREHEGSFSYFGEADLMLPTMDWLKREGDGREA